GVNTGVFFPDPGVEKKQHQIIFVGHLSVPHNVDAAVHLAEDIFPLVKSRNPDAELLLVGAHPNPKVNSLGEIDGVKVTGYVDDLNRILNQSTVFAAPLRFAAGVQNKVLEACAAGLPVVTSPMVGNGIGLRESENVLYGSDQVEYAEHILELFADPIIGLRIAEQARAFVLKNYNWDLVNQRINTIQSIQLSK
ncbi:MAG: glycosyltransferase, partial [Aliifodinibius sp.]|nr:glycosyltransferase [candidate division Zixibacteria bacterium]NIT55396.1 glycosyltransferase [Fodinibius sp.]NIW43678.1 glycosyltransferase [Gammaproteobacteria bacterium]NIR62714.1 glycosyltransferase [candidate division Zixibacteria bacterium]NIS44783.1 glycosyltransferase [candidate division Zixibacteria bacterium]